MPDHNYLFEIHFDTYQVKTRDPTSPAYFSAALTIALKEYGVPASRLTDTFKITEGILNRWIDGRSLPVPLVRQCILERLLDDLLLQ